jgi:hypothetical protein
LLIAVSEFFDLDREIVAIAMSHLDRYVATFPKHTAIDKNCFQLAAMTCFYLAIKLTHSKILLIRGSNSTLETISMLSKREVSVEEIEQMELELLDRLQWHVHPPTPHAFLQQFMELIHIIDDDDDVYERARFLIEESTKESCFLIFSPSNIAAAALWNAMEMLSISTTKIDDLSLPTHHFDVRCTSIQACRIHMSRILDEQDDDGIIGENGSSCQSPTSVRSPTSVTRGDVGNFTSPTSIRDPFTI